MFKKNVFACLLLLLSWQLSAQVNPVDFRTDEWSLRKVSVNPELSASRSLAQAQLKDPTVLIEYALSTPGWPWWWITFTDATDNSKVYQFEINSAVNDGWGYGELGRIPVGRYNIRFDYWWYGPQTGFYYYVGCQQMNETAKRVGYEVFDVDIPITYDCPITISD